jgi:hypothetical protein
MLFDEGDESVVQDGTVSTYFSFGRFGGWSMWSIEVADLLWFEIPSL